MKRKWILLGMLCFMIACGLNANAASLKRPVITGTRNELGGISVTWNKVSGAKKYYLYRKVGNGAYKRIFILDTSGYYERWGYLDTAVKSGKKYSYKVVACYGNKKSKASKVKSIKRNTNYLKAYIKYLKNYYSKYGNSKGTVYFELNDDNKKRTPYLAIWKESGASTSYKIYTYKNGKVVKVSNTTSLRFTNPFGVTKVVTHGHYGLEDETVKITYRAGICLDQKGIEQLTEYPTTCTCEYRNMELDMLEITD